MKQEDLNISLVPKPIMTSFPSPQYGWYRTICNVFYIGNDKYYFTIDYHFENSSSYNVALIILDPISHSQIIRYMVDGLSDKLNEIDRPGTIYVDSIKTKSLVLKFIMPYLNDFLSFRASIADDEEYLAVRKEVASAICKINNYGEKLPEKYTKEVTLPNFELYPILGISYDITIGYEDFKQLEKAKNTYNGVGKANTIEIPIKHKVSWSPQLAAIKETNLSGHLTGKYIIVTIWRLKGASNRKVQKIAIRKSTEFIV